jgi:hypothetical protein
VSTTDVADAKFCVTMAFRPEWSGSALLGELNDPWETPHDGTPIMMGQSTVTQRIPTNQKHRLRGDGETVALHPAKSSLGGNIVGGLIGR